MANDRQTPWAIDPSMFPGNVANFPVLFTRPCFSDEMFDPSDAKASRTDGGDVRFFEDGADEQPREIVAWEHDTTSGAGDAAVEMWGLVADGDAVAGAAGDYQYGDAALTEPAVTDTFGRNAVWADYEVVMHLTSKTVDSTGNHTASETGTVSNFTGKFGGSSSGAKRALNGNTATDYLTITGLSTLTEPFTLQAWAQHGAIFSTNSNRAAAVGDPSVATAKQQLFQSSNHATKNGLQSYNGTLNDVIGATTGADNTWALLHGVFSADNAREAFVNGASAGASTVSMAVPGITAFRVHADAGSTPYGHDSKVDEARLRRSALTSDWIGAEHNNQSAPATYITAGAPEAVGGGTTIPIGLATETDAGFAVTAAKARAAGLANEADTALALAWAKARAIDLALETDTAFDLQAVIGVLIGQAIEADSAFAMIWAKARAIGLAGETDTALVLTVLKALSIGLAAETDTGFAVTHGRAVAIGQAVETDAALGVALAKLKAIGLATETDTALALVIAGVLAALDHPLTADVAAFARTVAVTDPARTAAVTDPARSVTIN